MIFVPTLIGPPREPQGPSHLNRQEAAYFSLHHFPSPGKVGAGLPATVAELGHQLFPAVNLRAERCRGIQAFTGKSFLVAGGTGQFVE